MRKRSDLNITHHIPGNEKIKILERDEFMLLDDAVLLMVDRFLS